MRKSSFFFLLMFTATMLHAQDYLICFAGSGAATVVDSVRVENLTQGTGLTVGFGNQLQLLGVLSAIAPVTLYENNSLSIYPNPSKGDVSLAFEAIVGAETTIEIASLSGRLVAQNLFLLKKGLQSFRISNLNCGFYTVQVRSTGFQYTGKMISQSTGVHSTQIIYCGQSAQGGLKQTAAIVPMQYTTGDLLKFTGKSGIHATVVMDVPTTSKTIQFAFAPCTDYDVNHYSIVKAGTQTWMAENLRSTHYPDGTTVAYFDYNHDPGNSLIYGRLYAWSEAMNGAASSNTNPSNVQGVCPDGWHLPSKAEWEQFAGFLGGVNMAGGKIKETGYAHWISPNAGATDEVGFTALPAGIWAFWDEFQWKGDHCAFSTSTGNLPMVEVTTIMLQTSNGIFTVGTFHPDDAVSVRCLKN